MKFRLFAVTVLLICFYGQASAQTYHIRVTQNTNLRASYSLQSGIAETVPAGTTLQVGGSFNRWLSISRNGEVWMADWVPYDRVESAQTPSDVNNCCFVDRQCATDQEWTDGYWAFQNNQCPVSPPATRQTSTQPSTTQPQSIDNCCFVDRQCTTDQQWTAGYWAYQNSQCGYPTQSKATSLQTPVSGSSDVDNCCFIGWACHSDDDWAAGFHAFQNNSCAHPWVEILGPSFFLNQVNTALDTLQSGAPHWYQYTGSSGLRRIEYRADGGFGGFNPHKLAMYTSGDNGNPMYFLSAIVHEACHAERWIAGTHVEGWRNEVPCVQAQIDVISAIEPSNSHVFGLAWLLANIEDPSNWWWTD